jgi:membrane protein DedA with SNARE-associated domain
LIEFFSELAKNAFQAFNSGHPIALLLLFLISALTEIGIPFPFILDTLLILAGYQTGIMQIGLIMLSLMLGREVGATAIYWLARVVGKVFVNWISKRFPVVRTRMQWLEVKLRHRAPLAVAIARLTPGLLTPSTVAAGVMCLRYWYLVLGIAISSVIADAVLLIVGFGFGQGIKKIGLPVWTIAVAIAIVISAGWGIQILISRRNRNKDPNTIPKS